MSLDTKIKPNRLAQEKSPYLLQHAYNSVDWYPWGSEAFEKASKENKPVLLSIGYSTCHWCHVMEQESFEDEEIAKLINNHFVAIKVDREERPDVDSVYMTVCQALTGSGGWPMTVMMTADQKPFFVGTYYPKEARYGRPGLMDLLSNVAKKWDMEKESLVEISHKMLSILSDELSFKGKRGDLSRNIIKRAIVSFKDSFDSIYGGFREAPKFPTPHNLMFLLRYYKLEKDGKALEIVEKTLDQMYKGGIFDHIGFGFSRYSTDNMWLVPHFEKMLYDNALLTIIYLEAYQVTGKKLYKIVAEKVMDYVLRELTDEAGGFYCAQDADSEGEEGKYYVFTPDEIIVLLGEEDGAYFNNYFHITERGNFGGKSIPNRIRSRNFEESDEKIEKLCKKVYAYRLRRTHLHKDDKIITSWNALMIVAFAKAYKILQKDKYLTTAKSAVRFVEEKLINHEGRLLARYREGDASYLGYLEDYAFFVWALMEIYDATFEISFLNRAFKLNQDMIELFWDNKNFGFYLYGVDGERLIGRPKELYDGAVPSGNSVAAYNLIKLARLTGNNKLEKLADSQLKFFIPSAKDYPMGYSFYMMALLLVLYPSKEIICILKDEKDQHKIKKVLERKFMPNSILLIKHNNNEREVNTLIPFIKEYKLDNNKETYYICSNNTCSAPIYSIEELEEYL